MQGQTDQTNEWFKSSFCGGQGGGCVEIALLVNEIAIRDGKDPESPVLKFTPAEWLAFLAGARSGEFDLG